MTLLEGGATFPTTLAVCDEPFDPLSARGTHPRETIWLFAFPDRTSAEVPWGQDQAKE